MPRAFSAPATREADAAAPYVIEVEGLAAGYDETPVLEDVSFRARTGETLVVVGSSGCGKSTLLRCLVGLLAPSRGVVRVRGQDLADISPDQLDAVRRQMGVAFQGSALLSSLTLGENVSLPLREHTALDANTIRIMTRIKLEQVGLRGVEDKLPSELSGGMRKRAGIARALAMEPKVLLLDEPSAGLDPITAAGLDELLLKLRHALGLSMVVVTHELDSIRHVADRVLFLDKGRVRLDGTLADAERSADARVRQFFDRRADVDEPDAERLMDELTR